MVLQVIIWSNCQAGPLNNLFIKFFNKEVVSQYFINYRYMLENKDVPDFSNCDVFIYQNYEVKGKYDLSTIISNLKPGTMTISLPYLYFDGYWGSYEQHPLTKTCEKNGMFSHCLYHPVMETLKTREEIPEIVDKIFSEDAYSKEECLSTVKKSLDFIRDKEKTTTIKDVSYFIESNFRKEKLFYTNRHPTGVVLAFVYDQIFKNMALLLPREIIERETMYSLDFNSRTAIPPSVALHLSLEFSVEEASHKFIPEIKTARQFVSRFLEDCLLLENKK
jgi:hypothetical protein